jgi:hypothetical protein
MSSFFACPRINHLGNTKTTLRNNTWIFFGGSLTLSAWFEGCLAIYVLLDDPKKSVVSQIHPIPSDCLHV